MASAATQESPDVPLARLSLSVDHSPSTSPFPSPGSPFLPPPRLSAHEFALRTSVANTHMRNSVHKRREDEHPPSDEDATPTTASMKTSFPRSGASPPATPTLNGSASHQDTTPPTTPKITIPESTDMGLAPNPHRDSLTSSRPAPPSPAISRRASTALSRRSSAAKSRRQSKVPQAQQDNEASTSSATAASPQQPKRRSLLVKIRDFAFPSSDDRHTGRGTDVPRPNRRLNRWSTASSASSSSASGASAQDNDGEDQRGSWGSFRWNTLSSHFSWGAPKDASTASSGPSRTDFERNFDVSSPAEESPDPYADADEYGDEEAEEDDDFESAAYPNEDEPLVPGVYRALFAFEPEGTAEMALEEEQVVRVVGRGGGVGWAVVEKEGGGQALVPESYLELVKADAAEGV